MVKHLNRLPREVVDTYCLPVFKRRLDNALSYVLFFNVLLGSTEVVRQLISEGHFQLNNSVLI